MPAQPRRPKFFPDAEAGESTFLGRFLREETIGGAVVLAAAALAVLWANSPLAESYQDLRGWVPLPAIGLDMQHWAADGALSLFFFIAGLELKREFLVGSLRRPADAAVPIVAAAAGVALPALIYVALNAGSGALEGWAIPAATDIAFALAVLAVVGSSLPQQLRAFLLTLAIVDDLLVIVIIAAFYTDDLALTPLLATAGALGAYAFLQQRRVRSSLLYVPIAVTAWWFMHESGVHATIAGVALGLLTRVLPDDGERRSPAERLEHRLLPLSAGVAVPFFALMSAGVTVDLDTQFLTSPVVLGVVLGLVVGKPAGVMAGAWLITRLTNAELNPEISWRELFGVAVLAGVGFTVALLVAELSFTGPQAEAAKTAVLLGSVVAAGIAAVVLRRRNRVRQHGHASRRQRPHV